MRRINPSGTQPFIDLHHYHNGVKDASAQGPAIGRRPAAHGRSFPLRAANEQGGSLSVHAVVHIT